jgi:hypothetical protein
MGFMLIASSLVTTILIPAEKFQPAMNGYAGRAGQWAGAGLSRARILW